ncbi:MAG: archaellum operon transcriptional activator EarA family protein [Desulfurococcales archaeon]|nr:archaellum operon transcriptional activator EarA family protein [Desulfurococcales archaeon]
MNTIDLNVTCNETTHSEVIHRKDTRALSCLLAVIELFKGSPYLRILEFMSMREKNDLFTVRRIARNIDMNHKNVIKYLDSLITTGLIEIAYIRNNMKLYRLTEKGYALGSRMLGEKSS